MCAKVILLLYLRMWWEYDEGPLLLAIKEALEMVSHALKLKLVLQKTFKHYDIFGNVRGGLLELEFHFDLDVGALLFELLELF